MPRPPLLPVLAIVFAAASVVITLTRTGGQASLLIAQVIGTSSVALIGLEFLRRRALRAVGWLMLGLAAATYVILATVAARLIALPVGR